MFAGILSLLEVVFGPGGLEVSAQNASFVVDPQALHVGRTTHAEAHHSRSEKPITLLRDESLSTGEWFRYQIRGFGAPCTPLSCWPQAELVQLSLRAVLAGLSSPKVVRDPVHVLKMVPTDMIPARNSRMLISKKVSEAEAATRTAQWLLQQVAPAHIEGSSYAERLELLNKLATAAVQAVTSELQPPVLATDIALKRTMIDEVAPHFGYKSSVGLLSY